MNLPPQTSSDLGVLDYKGTVTSISKKSKKKRTHTTYTQNVRFKIGVYPSENGNFKPLGRFKQKFPNLKESRTRTFKKQYQYELKCIVMKKRFSNKAITEKRRGRPLFLRRSKWNDSKNCKSINPLSANPTIDHFVILALKVLRSYRGVVNSAVATVVADL